MGVVGEFALAAGLMASLAPATCASSTAALPVRAEFGSTLAPAKAITLARLFSELGQEMDARARLVAKEAILRVRRFWRSAQDAAREGGGVAAVSRVGALGSPEWGEADILRHAGARRLASACREAVLFAQRLPAGKVEAPSADMLELARLAVQRQAQQEEDVEAWAERLAREVGDIVD
jgi:hypothetical protein